MGERDPHEQAILAEIPWLRQLARELTGDAHGREDLVQDTCWIALTRPPRAGEHAALRAWLRTVIRNLSWVGQRTRARSADREQASARAEALQPVDELVARAELQRRLLAEVLALSEAQRDVLLLRYYRGLDTATIARELRLSNEAVRQRQARALAALRERTRDDASLRDLLSSVAVLQPLAGTSARALRWSALVCCALVAALSLPTALRTFTQPTPRPALALAAGAVSEATPPVEAAAGTPAARAPAQAPAPTTPWLVLRVREARGQAPLSGAKVARARAKDWEQLNADVEATWSRLGIAGSAGSFLRLSGEEALPDQPGTEGQPPFAPLAESVVATSDARGLASVNSALPSEEYLVIRCAGHGARFVSVSEVMRLGKAQLDVDLHALGKLPLRVHTLEGEAIEDAFLRLEAVPFLAEFQPQPTLPLVDGLDWHGPTDAQGKYEFADLPLDEALIVTPLSRWIGKATDVLVPAGAPLQPLDLVVVAPGTISGRLVDAQHAPVVGALVLCRPTRPWFDHGGQCMTDEEGGFSLLDLPAGSQVLRCSPDFKGGFVQPQDRDFPVAVEPFAHLDVGEWMLGAAAPCSGRVIGLGHPGKSMIRIDLLQGERSQQRGMREDGGFKFTGEPGPARVVVILRSDGDAGRTILERDVVLPCDGLELDATDILSTLTFRLAEPLDPTAMLSAHFYNHALDSREGWPAWEGALSYYELQATQGLYRVDAIPSGKYRLELQGPKGLASWVGEVQFEAGHVQDLGSLTLGTGALEGTLSPMEGPTDVFVVRRVPGSFGRGAFGDDHFDRRGMPLNPDGSFRFEGLPAGLWCVTANRGGFELTDGVLADLHVGQRERVDLQASRAGMIHCRVLQGGVPVVGAIAQYSFASESSMRPFFELNPTPSARASDAEGRINLGTFFPGIYQVAVTAGESRITRRVEIAWGQQLELEFDSAWPEVQIAMDLPAEWLDQLWGLDYHAFDPAGPAAGLEVSARRIGMNGFVLHAPPSEGFVELKFQQGSAQGSVQWPLTLRAGQSRIELKLHAGEILLRMPSQVGKSACPALAVVELPTGKIPMREVEFTQWPLEPLGAGRWLARGIPAGATLRLQPGDQRTAFGAPAKFVHFESGRVEVSWP